MISKTIDGTSVAFFGQGTIKVRTCKTPELSTAQLELTTCEVSKLGEIAGPCILNSEIIVLDFSSVESVDVFMKRLQVIKDILSEKHH